MICSNQRPSTYPVDPKRSKSFRKTVENYGRVARKFGTCDRGGGWRRERRWIRILYTRQRERERENRGRGISSVCIHRSILTPLWSTTPFFQPPRTWYSNARRMSSRGRWNIGELSTRNTIRDGWWFTRSSDTMIYEHVLTCWNLCNLRGLRFSSTYCVSRGSGISTFWVLYVI